MGSGPWLPPQCHLLPFSPSSHWPPNTSLNSPGTCLACSRLLHFVFSARPRFTVLLKCASSARPSLTILAHSSSSPFVSTALSITCLIFLHRSFLKLYVHLWNCSLFADPLKSLSSPGQGPCHRFNAAPRTMPAHSRSSIYLFPIRMNERDYFSACLI